MFGDLTQLARRLHDYARGDRFFDARLAGNSSDPPKPIVGARLAPWEAALALGDFDARAAPRGGIALIAKAAALAPDEPEVHERRALLAFQQQNPTEALQAAERALRSGRPRPLARLLRALALIASGDILTIASTGEAEGDLRRAIAESPSLAPAYATLGDCWQHAMAPAWRRWR